MSNEFYRCMFFDKEKNKTVKVFVFTRDINNAVKLMMKESPQINILSWKQIDEDQLPLVAVVVQK